MEGLIKNTMLVPSPEEVRARAFKSQALLEKAVALDHERAHLEQQLAGVRETLHSTWAEYSTIHNETASINRLPPELLCLIFARCVDPSVAHRGVQFTEVPGQTTVEVTLSHVCQHWRKVALGSPTLWTSFKYETPHPLAPQSGKALSEWFGKAWSLPTPKMKNDSADRYNAYLTRSFPLPIELFVSLGTLPHEDLFFLALAAQHCHRWKGLTVVSDDNISNWSLVQSVLAATYAPDLEYFSFRPSLSAATGYGPQHLTPVSSLNPKVFQLGAPKLSRIRMDSTVPWFFMPPLANVTCLCIDGTYTGPTSLSWPALLELVSLPSLRSLSIGGDVVAPPSPNDREQPITALCLTHLRWAHANTPLHAFLSHLTAPSLQTLILCETHDWSRPYRDPRLRISLPSLRSLFIAESGFLSKEFLRFIADASPGLKELTMSYYHPDDGTFLHKLTEEYAEGRMHWPNLEKMTCYLHGRDGAEQFLEFFEARGECEALSASTGGTPATEPGRQVITLRVSQRLYSQWTAESLVPEVEALLTLCALAPWSTRADIMPSRWPPDDSGPLSSERSVGFHAIVDWNEL